MSNLPSAEPYASKWEKPTSTYHAHFDCFSGAAGDMLLASCLDVSGNPESLLQYVINCLKLGLPDIADDFDVSHKRVWRGGMGSIAGLLVTVDSRYNHEAAPVPKPATMDNEHSHSHEHGHHHEHKHSHDHHHSHGPNDKPHHNHQHDHHHEHRHVVSNNDDMHDHDHDHDHHQTENNEHDLSGHSHEHAHGRGDTDLQGPLRNLPEIRELLEAASDDYIKPWVKATALKAFNALAEAEAATHGASSKEAVHFHEVGAIDSIVDTVGTLVAIEALGITTVTCSRLPLGEGTCWTMHGLLPVPAPATLRLLVDMPTCPGPPGTTGELVTPTGAALLRALTILNPDNEDNGQITGRPPSFTVRAVGIGAGTKDFEKHPNIVRLLLGDSVDAKIQK